MVVFEVVLDEFDGLFFGWVIFLCIGFGKIGMDGLFCD